VVHVAAAEDYEADDDVDDFVRIDAEGVLEAEWRCSASPGRRSREREPRGTPRPRRRLHAAAKAEPPPERVNAATRTDPTSGNSCGQAGLKAASSPISPWETRRAAQPRRRCRRRHPPVGRDPTASAPS